VLARRGLRPGDRRGDEARPARGRRRERRHGELIEDGRTGRTYPPGDPAALAAAVEGLLGDDEHRARIAEAGRRFAARTFNAEDHAAAFAEVLDEVAR
jgi:glycosyltransferase involved in cell wall biosynthesis